MPIRCWLPSATISCIRQRIDYGGDAGGYILKDKLFWYGGFNPLYMSNYRQADPVYANYALGVINREITTYDYTGKLNYNLGAKHQFEGSVFGDPSSTPMTFQGRVSSATQPRRARPQQPPKAS